jgi:hypothetical protein
MAARRPNRSPIDAPTAKPQAGGMATRILCVASVLLGGALVVHGFIKLYGAQTSTQASRIGLELSFGAMMLILGVVYLRRKGSK